MILFISICTLILTLIQIFYNYRINSNGLYLSGFLISSCISALLHYFTIIDSSPFYLAIVYGHFMPVLYLSGPMLFFYVRGALKDSSKLNLWDCIHFLPALVGLISIFPYYFEEFGAKLLIAETLIKNPNHHLKLNISWLYDSSYNLLVRTVLLVTYIIGSLFILIRYQIDKKGKAINNFQKKVIINWLYAILLVAGVCSTSYLLLTIDFFNGELSSRDTINSLNINHLLMISFSLIPVLILFFPQVLYGIPVPTKKEIKLQHSLESTEVKKPINTISIKDEKAEDEVAFHELTEMVMDYLKREKPFTNPNFSLDDLAKSLDVQRHHLYYCFNSILNSRFTTVRAQLRVEYAKDCLLRGDLNQLSMEGIWTKAGFSSRTSFFVSFKETTGLTPIEFIKINQIEGLEKDS
jgi:AraC-like DNA-binding protein